MGKKRPLITQLKHIHITSLPRASEQTFSSNGVYFNLSSCMLHVTTIPSDRVLSFNKMMDICLLSKFSVSTNLFDAKC